MNPSSRKPFPACASCGLSITPRQKVTVRGVKSFHGKCWIAANARWSAALLAQAVDEGSPDVPGQMGLFEANGFGNA